MKKCLFILTTALLSITQGIGSPFNQGFWCEGSITLNNQKVITGQVSYDLKFNAVQVRRGGVVRTYTAENVDQFSLFDQVKHRQRHYVALDVPLDEGYQRKTFFEVLTDGDLTVLRRTKYLRRPRVTEDFRAPHIYLNAVCRHTYYVFNDGKFFQIEDFKEQVLPLMTRHEEVVKEYIQQCRLKLRKIHEQMRVVHLYNQLRSQEANEGALTEVLK